MPVINGVYTKDFPALGRAPIDTDIIPIAKVANQITYKTTLGEIFNAKVFGTTGRLSKFTSANTLGNSILNEIGNAIHLTNAGTSFASFGIINPGTPGDPGIDNDAYIGSTINNDFTIRVNNVEAARFDTALRFKIANIQNADTDTDKFLVSDGGVVKYRTGTELRSDIGAGVGSVTSVGLTMPVAFSVANSPITSAGTLAVTAVGSASQYIRGDGQLATLPTGAGGGSAVNYYLNGSVASGVAGYQQMDNTAIIGTGTDFTLTGNGLIAQFLTDAGNPNRLLIPGGSWNLEMFFQISSSGGNAKFYVDLFKYDGTTFTNIASGVTNPEEITGGTSIDLYLTSLGVPETALLITDRLAIQVYIVDNSGGRTVTLHTEDNTLCQVTTTFAGGISALNGLTANTQYFAVGTSGTDFNISSLLDTHTFNLPTASATKRGALSASDWSTFNGKQPAGNYVTLDTNQTIAGEKTFTAGNIFIDSRSYFAEDNGQSGQAGYTQMITLADSFSFINGATTKAAQFIYGGGVRSYTLPSANGTLALTSDLSAYVTLATTQTITGAKTFSVDTVVNGVNIGRGGGNVSSNTANGYLALSNNTTGVYNTANGFNALILNTTGQDNTANGFNALSKNITGSLNTANGSNALYNNTTGFYNTANGFNALYSNTTGSLNTANGFEAGTFANSGAFNQTSTTSIYLGVDTRSSASGNTNEIVIGAYGRGLGSNTTVLGNSSTVFGRFWGNLLVGDSSNTGQALQITGNAKITGTITNGTYTYTLPNATGTLALTSNITSAISGTTNYIPKFTGASTIGNSAIYDNSGNIGIGIINPSVKLQIVDASTPRFYLGTSDSKFAGLVYSEVGSFGSLAIRGQGNDIGTVIHIDRGNSEIRFTTNEIPRLTLNASGNLGLGVTPSAWQTSSTTKAFEIGYKGNAIYGVGASDLRIMSNTYFDGAYKYADSASSALYNQTDGKHIFYNAPSGTAGNAITFTQAMTLGANGILSLPSSGSLEIGYTSSPSLYKLDVSGTGRFANGLNVNSTGTEMVNITAIDNSGRQGIRLNNGINSSTGIALFNSASSTGTTTQGLLIVDQASPSLSQPSIVIAQQGAADFIRGLGPSSSLKFNITNAGAATFSSSVTANSRSFINGAVGYLFDVQENTANQSGLQIYADGSEVALISRYNTTAKPLSFYTGGVKRLEIASTGAATFSSSVNVGGVSANTDFRIYRTVDPTAFFHISAPGGDPLTSILGIGNTNVMSLNASGNVGIGTTTPSYQLQLSTDSAAKPTSALWTIASDERIKENISPYTKGLDVLMSINPVTYDYNGLGGFKKGKGGVGIIAQEIMNILPDSVNSVKGKLKETDKEEIDILNFNGHELTYVLINAIKELNAKIKQLENK